MHDFISKIVNLIKIKLKLSNKSFQCTYKNSGEIKLPIHVHTFVA